MHVDPRASVLSNGLDYTSRLADYTTGFHIMTKNAVGSGYHQRRVLLLLCLAVVVDGGATAAVTVVIRVVLVIVVPRFGPAHGGFIIIVLMVVVVIPLRSRSLHLQFKKNSARNQEF